eukprot:TRINITY_DN20468_c0_g1_i1.p1 TRINITY_DN20468_c0_g1~~TRINITY_DN20468_c0_g1_i1.p1  ORF type:complete len:393 (+),score=57.59 TRINITY_DN20468_c0_g1_i1:206-1384(+)
MVRGLSIKKKDQKQGRLYDLRSKGTKSFKPKGTSLAFKPLLRNRKDCDKQRYVSYIHVGDAGKDDLDAHLKGTSKMQLQVFFEESLPDLEQSDIVNGLDHVGTSADFCDEGHRCSRACPVGCQGHLRPNEIMIYEGLEMQGKLVNRKRYKARFILPISPRKIKKSAATIGAGSVKSKSSTDKRLDDDVGEAIPEAYAAIINNSRVSAQEQSRHGWNPEDRSNNLTIKNSSHLTVRRQPVTQSTDAVRGKSGCSRGIDVYEMDWPVRMRGTNAAVGIATKSAPLHSLGYQNLIGNNTSSWGWDIGRKEALVNGKSVNYPSLVRKHYQWSVPQTFYMVIDRDEGTLSFIVRNKWLGVACSGIQGETVYPAISTVWGHAEVSLRYIGSSLPYKSS